MHSTVSLIFLGKTPFDSSPTLCPGFARLIPYLFLKSVIVMRMKNSGKNGTKQFVSTNPPNKEDAIPCSTNLLVPWTESSSGAQNLHPQWCVPNKIIQILIVVGIITGQKGLLAHIFKPKNRQQLTQGRPPGKPFNRVAIVRWRKGGAVRLPVAGVAEDGSVRRAEYGSRGGIAGVTEQGAGVLGKELVGGVHLPVTGEAKLR
nr:hypothetical protein Iba_chr12fCG13770 [Ipomoea batatas]